MGKKLKQYKSGDFIFAKVKGYPAWPARVQRLNGKKYFVYFYGTGETANLPPNMIFDYAENKDKFLTKTVKRRDFNDGVKQIEYDFANNVPLEQVIGVPMEVGAEGPGDETANDSAMDATLDETAADTTANDTASNDTANDTNVTQNDAAIEDSDEAGALVIDEGTKATGKGRKSKAEPAKTPAKEAPKVKEPKTPRGKAKKDETKEKDKEEDKEKIDEELVSRSGRKIRPKRYIDEQTEENATLPSPAPKRRRGASPATEKIDSAKEKADTGNEKNEKSFTQFNAVKQSELEVLKVPFKPVDEEKDNILIAYLPNGTYVGVKLFQSRPSAFKNESSRLQWEKQAAANAITLKTQLERNQITPQSVQGQLVMDLNLTDEEKATLDKERDTEEKRSRVNFLKSEMKLIELDAKIKTCLSLEKADTELCLTLLDELLSLDVKPLMLLKHPTCLETVKRMRAYVGNTPSWDLSESDALVFSKQAHKIRKKADLLYKNMKGFFHTPDGLSFWEFFSERVRTFKEITADYHATELLELVHEPLELDQPHAHTMKSAIEKANHSVPPLPEDVFEDEDKHSKKKGTTGKSKKPHTNSTPSKSKRQSSRNKTEDDKSSPEEPPSDAQKPAEERTKEKETEVEDKTGENNADSVEKTGENDDGGEKTAVNSGETTAVNCAESTAVNSAECEPKEAQDIPKEPETTPQEANQDVEMAEVEKTPEIEQNSTETSDKEKEQTSTENQESTKEDIEKNTKDEEIDKNKDTDKKKETDKPPKEEKSSKKDKKSKEEKSDSEKRSKEDENEKSAKDNKNSEKSTKDTHKSSKDTDKSAKSGDKSAKTRDKSPKTSKEDKHSKDSEKREKRSAKEAEKSTKDSSKNGKDSDKSSKEDKSDDKEEKNSDDKDKQESGEPRAKRSRESKKIEPPPPRSPAKRKSKV